MNIKQTMVAAFLILGLLIAGCAQSTTSVRQDDGTYRTYKRLVFRSDMPNRSFSSEGDDMVATEFHDVTYAFPQGKGSFSKNLDKIDFEGRQVKCSIVGRELMINELRFKEFEKGDLVRITSDGRIFVNDVERKPLGNS
jgi:major membrane immunogen (membrane-anchored lipoprotein)